MPTINVLSKNVKKKKKKNPLKFSVFTAEKNVCILHGQVLVMFQEILPGVYLGPYAAAMKSKVSETASLNCL